ncbi:MAG: hypothetical protein IJD78_04135 [Clostridia bacterium]|nr:hypothetical protein [Clostridia bacterium]
MKKLLLIFMSFALLMTMLCNAYATDVLNRIYSDAVAGEAGEQVTIPVKIENNDGFMGFAVYVTYNVDVFTPVSVSKGTMLSGMFNDGIATSTNNSFKVVYTGTGNVTADGELFNITFDVADDVSGKYEIELTYSQQDTFNENWDDIVLNCENIETVITVNSTSANTTVTTTEPDVEETTRQPVAEPSTEHETDPADNPDNEKLLSVRMREWVNGLPFPLNIILGIFVIPVSYIVAIFE